MDEYPEPTDELVQERLFKNAFVDIEGSPEENSLGWVELLNHLAWQFDPASFRFGGFLTFSLRFDARSLPAKTLNRYYKIREAEFLSQTGRKPNSVKRRDLKDTLRQDLLRRALLNTELMEVIWLFRENEVWLGAVGEKRRTMFEELWARTFGLSLRMLVPITLGLELTPDKFRSALIESRPVSIWDSNSGEG
jgi:DNA recombination-dependent growth factor C